MNQQAEDAPLSPEPWSPRTTLIAACLAIAAIVLLFLSGREWIAARLDGRVPLSALKFIGLGLATFAGVWALLTETTYKDHGGRKRLTPAGYCALAIGFASLVFAAITFTMETFLADRSKLEARLTAERAKLEAESERRRAALEERLEKERFADRQRLVVEADGLRTRLLALTAAAESEGRDRRLARDLNRGTRDMLDRTQTALGQLERVLQPIDTIVLEVTWRIPGDTPELATHLATLRTYVRELNQPNSPYRHDPGIVGVTDAPGGGKAAFVFSDESPNYPATYRNPILRAAVQAAAEAAFVANDSDVPKIDAFWPSSGGDIVLALSASRQYEPPLRFYLDSGDLEITMYSDINTHAPPRKSGRIVSILDLEQAHLVFAHMPPSADLAPASRRLREAMRPSRVVLQVGGRRYILDERAFVIRRNAAGNIIYVASGLPAPA